MYLLLIYNIALRRKKWFNKNTTIRNKYGRVDVKTRLQGSYNFEWKNQSSFDYRSDYIQNKLSLQIQT